MFTAVEGKVQRIYREREDEGNASRADDDYYERQWSHGDSAWFVIVLLTTIGEDTDILLHISVSCTL